MSGRRGRSDVISWTENLVQQIGLHEIACDGLKSLTTIYLGLFTVDYSGPLHLVYARLFPLVYLKLLIF